MKKLIALLFLFSSLRSLATHNRAGEIVYKRIEPLTQVVGGVTVPVYTYSITIYTYTDHGQLVADRCVDTVYFGDGSRGFAYRINDDGSVAGCGPSCNKCGQIMISDPGYTVKLNIYTIVHTYSGAGAYLIKMLDPNRNAGVLNIPNSDLKPFYLESLLLINNFSGANTSPQFLYAPIDRACVGRCFYHNPGAYDVDGDSLSYELTTSRGQDGQTVTGYSNPATQSGGTYAIDAVTGKLSWCMPQNIGQYNLAFIVREWRKNTDGIYTLIGYVLRDMQVIVNACTYNNPPQVKTPADTCVEAGTKIDKSIYVTDVVDPALPQNTNKVTLTAKSGAFSAVSPKATLANTFNNTPYTAAFSWQTSCDHVRLQPYISIFKVTDQGTGTDQDLVNFGSYSIKVVPPSVKNVLATPVGSTMKISWSLSSCSPADNPLIGYKVYRKNDCSPYTFTPCSVEINPASGFSLIAQTSATASAFIDSNNGNGLVVGQNYSYLVVSFYSDGSQSYGSSLVCAKLKRDIPVLLNVDVWSTSVTNGSIYVRWSKPLVNTGNLDTLTFTGPYQFTVKYRNGLSGNFNAVYSTSKPYFGQLDTTYLHTGINTNDSTAYYKIEFTAGTTTVGSSQVASSLFQYAVPADRKINLSWKSVTPWANYKYTIKRKDPSASSFVTVATTSLTSYSDTAHIANRYTYCYKIISEGSYSDPTIFKPLIDSSQEVCATALDLTPPCSPTISIEAGCPSDFPNSGFVNVKWSNVRNICSDDVLKYVLFYKPTLDAPYEKIDTMSNTTLAYSQSDLAFIAGCYAVESVDSSGNVSPLSVDFCIDNCPEFELPNIFSPNNDKANDVFKAIKVRQIKEINLTIFDRWGFPVYKTKDPYFQWDGTSLQSQSKVSEGTFFYFCEVFEPRLTGIRKRELKGYVQVVR